MAHLVKFIKMQYMCMPAISTSPTELVKLVSPVHSVIIVANCVCSVKKFIQLQ